MPEKRGVQFAKNDDDLYEGFDDYNPYTTGASGHMYDDGAAARTYGGASLKTAGGQRNSMTLGANFGASRPDLQTRGGRVPTALRTEGARPVTAVKAAGFGLHKTTSLDMSGTAGSSLRGPAPQLEGKIEDTPEEKVKQLESKISEVLEESYQAAFRGDSALALEKAKIASKKERVLYRQREEMHLLDQINLDLTFCVAFNAAVQYQASDLHQEALTTYNSIVKNKTFSQAGRLRVNMGNIYFKQKQYAKAIRCYQMAVDQVPVTHNLIRTRIQHNIAIAFVKTGQYDDAVTVLEEMMKAAPSFKVAFDLILCHFALGDRERTKRAFQNMLNIDLHWDDEDKYSPHHDDKQYTLILEVIKNDELRQFEKRRRAEAETCIKLAAKIIAPIVGSPASASPFSQGYDWCIEQVKGSLHAELANDLEIDKAIMYLRQKDYQRAVESLKAFEKRDTKVASTAAVNLAFLYFIDGEMHQAEKYAEIAVQADRYNAAALVNRGNVFYKQRSFERARDYFKEATEKDSACIEASYNLGLTYKRLMQYEEALDCFFRLHSMLKNNPQIMYQIAVIHEVLEKRASAAEWYMQLIGLVPNDPTLLIKLADMLDRESDKAGALQYYLDAYRYYPNNMKVIEWLGAYYIDSQYFEKAIDFFERAAVLQPNQVKWQLAVASCLRRNGNQQRAFEVYKQIHRRFPDNTDCLQMLAKISSEWNLKEAPEYADKLKKLEKQAQQKQEARISSGSRRMSLHAQTSIGDNMHPASAGSGGLRVPGDSRDASRQASASRRIMFDDSDPFKDQNQGAFRSDADAPYSDPLGPQPERPKTAAARKIKQDDHFSDEEAADLLPD